MSYPQYNSYLSNLESLVFDSPNEVVQTEKDVADELDLWTNAQFSFDVKPGVGIYEDEKKSKETSPATQFESASGLDPVTYNTLVNYLDYELPQRQQIEVNVPSQPQKSQSPPTKKQRLIQPRPLAPALPTLAPNVPLVSTTRQVLMPKPPMANTTHILSPLLITPTTTVNKKKSLNDNKKAKSEEGKEVIPDEDKRRRNTAASARFRIKKKLREQAMEQSVREMTTKSEQLQDRINHLETEIKFLRSLLLNKSN
ncbi:uncharacterized protein BX663DRAFT_559712 [Cokeromyces recurvatus]|uniref:uncharacterized protein n=1 Tax=Cokeromyces recurvatus TaxID=90255 RepID=UPI00221EC53C|nr:uncharacterized protein BX663DRAFT_559712 [Cokeromyces recurvatus]KAI7904734.1 hypothetical protein BX663DRAFT_559712 [Cokeromyces recurvatus]